MRVYTVASHCAADMPALLCSAAKFGIRIEARLVGRPWGLMRKLKVMLELLAGVPDREPVLFVDAWDALFAKSLEGLIEEWARFRHPFVMGAETNCAPYPQCAPRYAPCRTRYPYLNTGTYMGEAGAIRQVLADMRIMRLPDVLNDQGVVTDWWLAGNQARIALDYECRLFQNLYMAEDDIEFLPDGPRNRLTGGSPWVIHGNGEADMSATRRALGIPRRT